MKVKGWSNGGGTYGLRVGVGNRDQHFDPTWTSISIEIEGEAHSVNLTAGFWKQCPEVRSPILRNWLHKHRSLNWPSGHPPVAELTPLGDNRFRLAP